MDSWHVTPRVNAFNIPAWSVSVEIFVYMVFYFVTSSGLTKGKGLPILIIVLLLINSFYILPPFKECLFFFFFGCMLARWITSGISLTYLLFRVVIIAVALVIAATFLKPYISETEFLNGTVIYLLRDAAVFFIVVLCFIITFRSAMPKFCGIYVQKPWKYHVLHIPRSFPDSDLYFFGIAAEKLYDIQRPENSISVSLYKCFDWMAGFPIH